MPLGSLALLLAQSGAPDDVRAPPSADGADRTPAAPAASAARAPAAPPGAPQQAPAAAAVPGTPSSTPAPAATPATTAPPSPAPPPASYTPLTAPPASYTPMAAPPTAFAPMAAPVSPNPQTPSPRERGTSMKGAVAAYYQRIFDVPIYGGGITFGVGPRKRDRTLFLVIDLDHGVTERGLSTWGGRVLFSPEWSFDRLRLGFGVGAGYFQMERVTNSGNLASFTMLCAELHASVDLVDTSDSGAFFLAAAMHVDSHFPAVWGPTASLGFRTDDL